MIFLLMLAFVAGMYAEALVERVNKDDEYEKARAQSIQPLIAELQELRVKLAKDQAEAAEKASKRKKNARKAKRPAVKIKGDKDQASTPTKRETIKDVDKMID